jgi:hypothetical protein
MFVSYISKARTASTGMSFSTNAPSTTRAASEEIEKRVPPLPEQARLMLVDISRDIVCGQEGEWRAGNGPRLRNELDWKILQRCTSLRRRLFSYLKRIDVDVADMGRMGNDHATSFSEDSIRSF